MLLNCNKILGNMLRSWATFGMTVNNPQWKCFLWCVVYSLVLCSEVYYLVLWWRGYYLVLWSAVYLVLLSAVYCVVLWQLMYGLVLWSAAPYLQQDVRLRKRSTVQLLLPKSQHCMTRNDIYIYIRLVL
jgi:hypothetical protein